MKVLLIASIFHLCSGSLPGSFSAQSSLRTYSDASHVNQLIATQIESDDSEMNGILIDNPLIYYFSAQYGTFNLPATVEVTDSAEPPAATHLPVLKPLAKAEVTDPVKTISATIIDRPSPTPTTTTATTIIPGPPIMPPPGVIKVEVEPSKRPAPPTKPPPGVIKIEVDTKEQQPASIKPPPGVIKVEVEPSERPAPPSKPPPGVIKIEVDPNEQQSNPQSIPSRGVINVEESIPSVTNPPPSTTKTTVSEVVSPQPNNSLVNPDNDKSSKSQTIPTNNADIVGTEAGKNSQGDMSGTNVNDQNTSLIVGITLGLITLLVAIMIIRYKYLARTSDEGKDLDDFAMKDEPMDPNPKFLKRFSDLCNDSETFSVIDADVTLSYLGLEEVHIVSPASPISISPIRDNILQSRRSKSEYTGRPQERLAISVLTVDSSKTDSFLNSAHSVDPFKGRKFTNSYMSEETL